MAGTVSSLRASTDVPDDLKRRAVIGHRERRKRLNTIGQKIRKLRHEGKPEKQAVAIAFSMMRRGEVRK